MRNIRKQLFNYYMTIMGILGQSMFFAQAYKIFTTQSAHDVSGLGFSIGLISVCSWLIYGIFIRSFPLIISNIVAVVGSVSVVIGILLYG